MPESTDILAILNRRAIMEAMSNGDDSVDPNSIFVRAAEEIVRLRAKVEEVEKSLWEHQLIEIGQEFIEDMAELREAVANQKPARVSARA